MSAGRAAPIDSLVAAAVAGLFAGCSGDPPPNRRPDPTTTSCPTTPPTTTPTHTFTQPPECPTPEIVSDVVDTTITFEVFKRQCAARGGLLQTTAACAGSNDCRGASFNVNTKVMTEHTCKAMNSCHGISCVELPADRGFDGLTVYQSTCGYVCHGPPAESTFLLMPRGGDPLAYEDSFLHEDRDYLISLIAFGNHAMNPNGTAAAMAPVRLEWSVEELGRAIDHMRTLPYTIQEYGTVGVDLDMN